MNHIFDKITVIPSHRKATQQSLCITFEVIMCGNSSWM